jgi:methanogenic corrinoid protein MtbC1
MDQIADTAARTVHRDFLTALLGGDARRAELVALGAVADGMAVEDLYVDVVGRALEQIGERWERGSLSVADEHLATGIAWDVMRLVARSSPEQPRRSRERILLAAVGGESHVTGLRMVGDLAEQRGFDVRYLGAAVPVASLGSIVARHEPEVVGLSVTMAGSAAELSAALEAVFASGHAPRAVLVGGRAVPRRVRDDPRVHVADDAREALAVIERVAEPAG